MKLLQATDLSFRQRRFFYLIKTVILILISIWVLGIFSPLLFPGNSCTPVKYCYSLTCHQNPLKTFVIGQNHLLVCSRCLGIYAGLLAASLLSLTNIMFNSYKPFLISCIILALDVFLYNLGAYPYSRPVAFFTGILLGSTGFFLILQGLEATVKEIIKD